MIAAKEAGGAAKVAAKAGEAITKTSKFATEAGGIAIGVSRISNAISALCGTNYTPLEKKQLAELYKSAKFIGILDKFNSEIFIKLHIVEEIPDKRPEEFKFVLGAFPNTENLPLLLKDDIKSIPNDVTNYLDSGLTGHDYMHVVICCTLHKMSSEVVSKYGKEDTVEKVKLIKDWSELVTELLLFNSNFKSIINLTHKGFADDFLIPHIETLEKILKNLEKDKSQIQRKNFLHSFNGEENLKEVVSSVYSYLSLIHDKEFSLIAVLQNKQEKDSDVQKFLLTTNIGNVFLEVIERNQDTISILFPEFKTNTSLTDEKVLDAKGIKEDLWNAISKDVKNSLFITSHLLLSCRISKDLKEFFLGKDLKEYSTQEFKKFCEITSDLLKTLKVNLQSIKKDVDIIGNFGFFTSKSDQFLKEIAIEESLEFCIKTIDQSIETYNNLKLKIDSLPIAQNKKQNPISQQIEILKNKSIDCLPTEKQYKYQTQIVPSTKIQNAQIKKITDYITASAATNITKRESVELIREAKKEALNSKDIKNYGSNLVESYDNNKKHSRDTKTILVGMGGAIAPVLGAGCAGAGGAVFFQGVILASPFGAAATAPLIAAGAGKTTAVGILGGAAGAGVCVAGMAIYAGYWYHQLPEKEKQNGFFNAVFKAIAQKYRFEDDYQRNKQLYDQLSYWGGNLKILTETLKDLRFKGQQDKDVCIKILESVLLHHKNKALVKDFGFNLSEAHDNTYETALKLQYMLLKLFEESELCFTDNTITESGFGIKSGNEYPLKSKGCKEALEVAKKYVISVATHGIEIVKNTSLASKDEPRTKLDNTTIEKQCLEQITK